ncbi:uncharacterized protein H6S33_006712 [Morchella sextelata]|uniref:uncharacterized protein n=1 Tax=Morchella sextelata TaxID=1174677 RepID=UPI001D0425B9|nr:uncharacterized protein H6S33_006712 [Morchella sextelata]KAH0604335.1 hypothetical protein H6S33_006712 [Morchella sextelata]
MWLKDFLPREASCENVRILSYGYNTKLVGKGTVDDTFLDYRRNFIQQLENARNSEEESERPIIFIGHSLGGIVILQALSQAKNRPRFHGHILDSTEAILFFGTPHAGLNGVSELMDMVRDMSGHGTPSSRIKLLSLLTEDSEFLATLRDGLTDIWDPDTLKVFSFYELGKTPTVQKELTAGEWKRFGKAVGMVKKMSALLHLRNEIPIPISRNHTEMVKFSSAADKDYRTVATHIGNCVKDIISREDSDEDDSEECGSDTTDPDERRRKRKRKRRRVISSRNNSESESDDEDESGSGTEGESSTPSSDSSDSSSESGENSDGPVVNKSSSDETDDEEM